MDYFSQTGRRRGNSTSSQDRRDAPLPAVPGTPAAGQQQQLRPPPMQQPRRPPTLEGMRAPSSIRIRRLPSNTSMARPDSQPATQNVAEQDFAQPNRRRSTSEPQRYGSTLAPPGVDMSRQRTHEMPTITEGMQASPRPPSETSQTYYDVPEGPATPAASSLNVSEIGDPAQRAMTEASAIASAGNAARANRGLNRTRTGTGSTYDRPHNEYDSDVVDLLDLVDPEVRTLGTLTNVQNSLFVPDLGRFLNRRPTYNLTTRSTYGPLPPRTRDRAGTATTTGSRPVSELPQIPQKPHETAGGEIEMGAPVGRRMSISSAMSDSRYAVLPHGIDLEGWTEDDKAELDDHVRHLLHSRKEGFKRSMRGFGKYISKPLGLFVFTYALLVTLFGAAWVFFLIGWIYVHNKQQYLINVIDNILVALFALMGDGLAPFRAVDTYHMIFIARYHYLTWDLRKQQQLPDLVDHNDLPETGPANRDDALDKEEMGEYSVLKPVQQKRLQYHQAKFSKAHTFYRPHETSTHHAFPLRLLITIVVLLDFHSFFQIALGTCTWSINYKTRSEALTSSILACSLTCNITAGILISIGDHRTRKKDVLERIRRQELTQEALERMAKERETKDRDNADHIGRKSVEVSRAALMQERARQQELEQQHLPEIVTPGNEGLKKKL